jgi:pimeloyl-ACP methyl ester carboxylesterase
MNTRQITLDGHTVDVSFTDRGTGDTVLLLHGGGGPGTVDAFAELLASKFDLRVITPIHPGFDGTARPKSLTTIAGLARLYSELLDDLDLTDVTVVGNSMGGWAAAEMALLHNNRIARVVLVGAVGLDLPDTPVVDFYSLTLDQVFDLSYHRPDDFRIDFSVLPPARQAVLAANRAALSIYGGETMTDPSLLGRLADAKIPALAIWGAADRIVPAEHGQAYAQRMPHGRFELITDAGHLPQLETPAKLAELIVAFSDHARP